MFVLFDIKKKRNQNDHLYNNSDLTVAYDFSKKIYDEFGGFLKAVVMFGSAARGNKKSSKGDIDILVVVDDVSVQLTGEMVEAYRLITEKAIAETSLKLHVITLKLTAFWDYIRNSDPVGINILRDGVALVDTGFFDPLQSLLFRGRIKPTQESVWTYFSRAPRTLVNAKWHTLQAVVDLYWAVIDSAHAALMKAGEIPPSPDHVSEMLKSVLVKKGLISNKAVSTMDKFYRIQKDITHRKLKNISGRDFDKLYAEADVFVRDMRRYIERRV
jgi:predicted nucleotidyltransferase/uncharacterized protein (UPF0332 family)